MKLSLIVRGQHPPGDPEAHLRDDLELVRCADRLGFEVAACERFRWKGDRDPMLRFELMQPV